MATFGAGYLAGIAPFLNFAQYVPGVHDLILLIPQGLHLLGPLTGALMGTLAVLLRARGRIGTSILRKAFRTGMSLLPTGLAVLEGEVIEDYPTDPRGHSCLILGRGDNARPIHIVCSPKDEYLAIITAYRPDPEQWSPDFKRRI